MAETRGEARRVVLIIVVVLSSVLACAATPDESVLRPFEVSARQRAMVDTIGEALSSSMEARAPEEALLVSFEDLYAPLTREQRNFLDAVRALEGGDPSVAAASVEGFVRVQGQRVRRADGERLMPLQLMPLPAWQAFVEMNEAMKADLGRGLVIGSGYRSPANQLFVFVRYMPYYDYSPDQTLPHVSLPGSSDHNRIERQGVDFVSEDGVDLRYSDPGAFRALEEFRWLADNAGQFGFVGEGSPGLSPWHWSFVGESD